MIIYNWKTKIEFKISLSKAKEKWWQERNGKFSEHASYLPTCHYLVCQCPGSGRHISLVSWSCPLYLVLVEGLAAEKIKDSVDISQPLSSSLPWQFPAFTAMPPTDCMRIYLQNYDFAELCLLYTTQRLFKCLVTKLPQKHWTAFIDNEHLNITVQCNW